MQVNGYDTDFSVKKLDLDGKLWKLNLYDIIYPDNHIMLSLSIDKETPIYICSIIKKPYFYRFNFGFNTFIQKFYKKFE